MPSRQTHHFYIFNKTSNRLRPLIILFFIGTLCHAQNYVDLLNLGFGQTFENQFENSSESTNVSSFDANLTVPLVLNDKHTLVTGGIFSYSNLRVFPERSPALVEIPFYINENVNLFSSTLKVGLATTYNEKWSSTLVLLPKIASDYQNLSSDDFYVGGYGIVKWKKNDRFIYKAGFYASQEAFGLFATPIFGWYSIGEDNRFEMDMSLPIAADINYTPGAITYGVNYVGIGRSFRVHNTESANSRVYLDVTALEFSGYVQFNFMEKSTLLRAKLGYSSNDYELYNQDETIDFGLSAFSFGDDRTQLNPNVSGSLFFRLEAIYRFHISSDDSD